MKMRNSGAHRNSTAACQALADLEVFEIGAGFVRGDLEPGDRVLIDWSQLPVKGEVGAVRVRDGVGFIAFDGDPAAKVGRLVNPSRLLEVAAA
jgi:hypothetical protein